MPARNENDPPSQNDEPTSRGTATAPIGRFARLAKLTGMTASVAARQLSQRVANAFGSDEDAAERQQRATQRSAEQVKKTLGELKGAAMKVGQLLATDPELLPPDMGRALAQLQHSAPPMDFSTVRGVVERALARKLEDVFEGFDPTPVGAASIGQVHRARTHDGLSVAVKVQYPGIVDTIHSDMKNLGALLTLARAQLPKERVDAYLAEITEVIERESDYELEAANLERFQFILKGVVGVRVPVPVHELTRKNVLVMEFFDGVRLEDWLAQASPAEKTIQGRRLVQAYVAMIHTHGVLHADPHPGNFLVLNNAASSSHELVPDIGILDLGCVRDYPIRFMDGQLEILAALWRHDLERLQATWRELGFVDDGVDPEVVYEWLQLILSPLMKNTVTDFGAWKIQDDALRFMLENPSIRLFAPPREALFYIRVLAGLRALMHKVGMKLNVHELSREVVRERGLL